MRKIYLIILLTTLHLGAIQNAQADASCTIGKVFYDKGNYKKAFIHMKKLSRYKNGCAKYYLALMYFYGQGTVKNLKLAGKYMDEAAAEGYPDAIGFFDRQE